jgi:uncharacterized surface protein with fasciclin (FAS1) repeats
MEGTDMKMKLLAVGLAIATFAVIPGSVSAHAYQATTEMTPDMHETRCDRIAGRLAYLNANFDQTNDRQLWRQQKLVDRQNHLGCAQPATVVDALAQNGNFNTLITAVTAANLGGALSAPGELTVFAPTDAAFAKLPAGTVEALVADVPTLTNILTNHVVGARANATDALQLGTVTALNGNDLSVTAEGGYLYIDGVKVVVNDIQTGNGVVHVIDTVLIP